LVHGRSHKHPISLAAIADPQPNGDSLQFHL
jgi:hypothetical protein